MSLQANGAESVPTCGRCRWEWYFNPAPSAVGLVRDGGRVLLVRRRIAPHRGYWAVPGGFVHGYESVIATVRRELREEVGIGVRVVRFLGILRHVYGPARQPTLKCFFEVDTSSGTMRAGSDALDYRWFPLGRLPARLVATDRRAIAHVRAGRVPFFG
jgi:8-oxo-dGTP diphosphatase